MAEFTNSSKDKGFVMFKDSAKRIIETDKRINADICINIVMRIINQEEIIPYTSIKNGKADWNKIDSNKKNMGN